MAFNYLESTDGARPATLFEQCVDRDQFLVNRVDGYAGRF